MRNWLVLLTFGILLFSTLPIHAAQRRITFVKEWEHGQVIPVFEKIYDTVVNEITLNDSFIVIDNNELQAKSSLILTSVFADALDPLLLADINQTLKLDIVMLLSEQQGSLVINTLEFPSGITIDKFTIAGNELDTTTPEAMIKIYLGGLIEALANNFTQYGYPFDQDECGIIIIADDFNSTLVRDNVTRMNRYYTQTVMPSLIKPLRFKIIETLDCEQASRMCTLTGAKFALAFAPDSLGLMDYHLTLIFPYMENNKPAITVEYPYLTQTEQLVCYEFAGENPAMEQLGELLFNERIDYKEIEIVPIFLQKLLNLHKEWATKKSDAKLDPEQINNYYILLYNQLPANSLTSAWVGLNYAGYYLQNGQYVMAGSLFNKVYGIFAEQSVAPGMILSLLGAAQSASILKNYPVAKRAFENVLKVYTIKDDSVTTAAVNYNLGLLAELSNTPQSAVNYYESSAYLYNKVNEKFKAMQIYSRIAQLLKETGETEKSVDYYNLYLARAEELFSEPDIAQAQFALGLAAVKDNSNSEAQHYLQNARNYYEMLGDAQDNLLIIDLKLGIIHFKNHDLTEAQKYLYASLENAGKFKNGEDFYDLYRYLGDLETANKNWNDAQKCYDVGLNRATQAKAQPQMAEFIYRKGLAHLKEGKVELGYTEVKRGIALSDGAVHGGRKNANEFLKKLDVAIKK